MSPEVERVVERADLLRDEGREAVKRTLRRWNAKKWGVMEEQPQSPVRQRGTEKKKSRELRRDEETTS